MIKNDIITTVAQAAGVPRPKATQAIETISIPCQPAKYLLSDFGQGQSAGYFVAKLMRFCHAPGRGEPRSAFGWGFRR